jgi:hypothetical protein
MKLALIPPYAHMDRTVDNYHLLLPQCFGNANYDIAVSIWTANDNYLILDNGAAEGIYTSVHRLHELAEQFGVNEIVVQDIAWDARATRDAVKEFRLWTRPSEFKYMAVVQGETPHDCLELIHFYLSQDWITCIGIPRQLIKFDRNIRSALAEYIRRHDYNIDIHLLGTSPDYILELRDLGSFYRDLNVRGVDTSAPFNYALANRWIGDGDVIPRPKDYFSHKCANSAPLLANIETMTGWAHGQL